MKTQRRILRILTGLYEPFYYGFLYRKPKIYGPFEGKRYLIAGGEDLEKLAEIYRLAFPEKAMKKIDEADALCRHEFDLLGSEPKKLSPEGDGFQPIDWHSDFKSGYSWNPKTFYSKIKYGHIEGVDIKVPWELSRFQHLNILGQAYLLSAHEKCAAEFMNQISDWIKANPVGFGVNWRCTMDVALRAANWLVGQEYFQKSKTISQEFWTTFYTSLYEHGRFIARHLENRSGFTSNHYLSDLTGLFFIAVYCPFMKESQKWKEFASKELCQEVDKQVYADGCDFEASTSYHRLVLELLFYAELLGERAGKKFPAGYRDKVRKTFDFSLHAVKPNGKIPQFGDNDNGRFLVFRTKPVLEHQYLLALASIYYRSSDYNGGYPEVVLNEPSVKSKILKNYYDILVYKDLVEGYSIRNVGLLKGILKHFITHVGAAVSINAYFLGLAPQLRVSRETILEYISYLERNDLVSLVPIFSDSDKVRQVNPRKIYSFDNGIRNAVSFNSLHDENRLVKNLVFQKLRREGCQVYYWKDRGEVDFVAQENSRLCAVNVAYGRGLNETDADSLLELGRAFGMKNTELTIITKEIAKTVSGVRYVPLWEWLLEADIKAS